MILGTIIFGAIFLYYQVYEFTHFVYHEGLVDSIVLSGRPQFSFHFYVHTAGTRAIGVFGYWVGGLFLYRENVYRSCYRC